jgi:hypothetical protein
MYNFFFFFSQTVSDKVRTAQTIKTGFIDFAETRSIKPTTMTQLDSKLDVTQNQCDSLEYGTQKNIPFSANSPRLEDLAP